MNANIIEQMSRADRSNIRLLRLVLGAGSATILLTFILLTRGLTGLADFRWMILPYMCVPVAGALAGMIYDMMELMRNSSKFSWVLSMVLSASIYALLFAAAFILGMIGPN